MNRASGSPNHVESIMLAPTEVGELDAVPAPETVGGQGHTQEMWRR